MEKQPTGPRKNQVYIETKDEQTPAAEILEQPDLYPLFFDISVPTPCMADRGSLQLSQTRQTINICNQSYQSKAYMLLDISLAAFLSPSIVKIPFVFVSSVPL